MTRHKNQPNRTPLRTGLPALLITFIFFAYSNSAFATQCAALQAVFLGEKFDASEAVFVGTILKVIDPKKGKKRIEEEDDLDIPPWKRELPLHLVKVEKSWKGVGSKEVRWRAWDPFAEFTGFAVKLRPGSQVFIYASRYGGIYESTLGPCSLGSYYTKFFGLKILFLDMLVGSVATEEAVRRMLFNLKPTGIQWSQDNPEFQNKLDEEFLKISLSALLESLEGRDDQIYASMGQILRMMVDKDTRVSETLWQIFKEKKDDFYEWSGGANHKMKLLLSIAYSLSQIKTYEIQRAIVPVLRDAPEEINQWAYWNRFAADGLSAVQANTSPKLWKKLKDSPSSVGEDGS